MIEVAFIIYAVVSLAVVYGLLVTIDRDRKATHEERRELLNRIKPETAQWTVTDTPEMVEPVRGDADYWSAHEQQIKEDGTFPYGGEERAIGR